MTISYPGVELQKLAPASKPRSPVTGASLAICGYTTKGPVSNPKKFPLQSWDEFVSHFGSFTASSRVPVAVYNYFLNGGSQVFVSRVLGTGNAAGSMSITETVADELATVTFNGGSTPPSGARGLVSASDHSATPSRVMTCNLGRDPQFQASSIVLKYWAIGAIVAFEGTQVGDGATTAFTFTPGAAGYNANATYLEPGSVRVQVNAATTYYDKGDGTLITGAGATGTINYATGVVAITFSVAPTLSHTITISYRRTAARVEKTVTISSADAFTGDVDGAGTNTINRETGVIVFTAASATYLVDGVAQANYTAVTDGYNWDGGGNNRAVTKVEVDYTEVFWAFTVKDAGAWGNTVQVRMSGDVDYFTSSTQTYTRYVIEVLLPDDTGTMVPVEIFRKLQVGSSADARWLSSVINDTEAGSDIVSAVAPFGGGAPAALNGTLVTAETLVADGGGAVQDVTVTLANLPGAGSVVISFTDSSGDTAHTIIDDGLGGLVGSDPSSETTLDSSVTATVNYETGAVRFKTAVAVKTGTPISATYYKQPTSTSVTVTATGGSDGAALARSNVSASALDATAAGIYAFKAVEVQLDVVQPPDFADSYLVLTDTLTFVSGYRTMFFFGDVPTGYTAAQAKSFRNVVIGSTDNEQGAIYWPWVNIKDPLTELTVAFPSAVFAAARAAATDRTKNPGKNPAGKDDGRLLGVLSLATEVPNASRGILDPYGVNCLMDESYTGGPVIMGANTLIRDRNSKTRFINASRGNIALMARAYASLWAYPFESNGPELRLKVKTDLESWLGTLWKAGWFKGATQSEAFYVVCDGTNNNSSTEANGQIIADVGVSWNKPALYVTFRLQQTAN